MRPIHLQADGPGDVVLTQDGVDLIASLGVTAVTFRAGADDVPRVALEVVEPFTYDGPAEVHVTTPPPPGVTVDDFLASIDAKELEQAALEAGSGLGGPGVGESFLIALKALARDLDGA